MSTSGLDMEQLLDMMWNDNPSVSHSHLHLVGGEERGFAPAARPSSMRVSQAGPNLIVFEANGPNDLAFLRNMINGGDDAIERFLASIGIHMHSFEDVPRPADPRRVQALPRHVFKKRHASASTNATSTDQANSSCVICLAEYDDGDVVVTMSCKHHYHTQCLEKWLSKEKKCPVCRHEI